MTRAAKAQARADAALREAFDLRDPVAISRASQELEHATRRVERQEARR